VGPGTVAAAGVVLPWFLADRLGLCTGLVAVLARAGFVPLRRRGRALVDAACVSDVEAMTAQEEIFGPGGRASDTTMLRVLDELAGRLRADGLPGRRLARDRRRLGPAPGPAPRPTSPSAPITNPRSDDHETVEHGE